MNGISALKITIFSMSIMFAGVLSLVGIGHWIAPVDTLREADAIIVVSGGGEERLEKGLELYATGYSDVLILSGDAVDPLSPSNAEVMRESARSRGVPAEDILVETESKTTYENARNVRKVLAAHNLAEPHALILVTSAYHQRRLLQNFEHIYADVPEIVFINQPASVSFWSRNGWWLDSKGIEITLKETVKVAWGGLYHYVSIISK